MNLRLSTSLLHQQGLTALMNRQSDLQKTQQELTTGKRISQAKEDPAAMAAAQRIRHAMESLEQFGRNSDRLKSRLEIQDTALADAGNVIRRATELAIQANTSVLSDANRQALAVEVRALRESLLSIANRDDGNGRALFAGTQDGVKPFTDNLGVVTYAGDDGQIRMDVGFDLAIKDTNPGSQVFMRVRSGDGVVATSAAASNTGTGVLSTVNVTDSTAWGGQTLTVRFASGSDYEVLDGAGNPLTPPVAGGGWQPGQKIVANGVEFTLTGNPAAGDTFTIQPAPNQDIFTTLQVLADAASATAPTPAARAAVTSALTASIASLSTAQDHLLSLRAGTGARLNSIELADEARSADRVSLAGNLSALQDADITEAISRLQLQLTAMEAAQATMVRIQGKSLFDRL